MGKYSDLGCLRRWKTAIPEEAPALRPQIAAATHPQPAALLTAQLKSHIIGETSKLYSFVSLVLISLCSLLWRLVLRASLIVVSPNARKAESMVSDSLQEISK